MRTLAGPVLKTDSLVEDKYSKQQPPGELVPSDLSRLSSHHSSKQADRQDNKRVALGIKYTLLYSNKRKKNTNVVFISSRNTNTTSSQISGGSIDTDTAKKEEKKRQRGNKHVTSRHELIRSSCAAMYASRAAVNFSVTTSHRSIRSSRPFSSASMAVVLSAVLFESSQ